MQQEDSQVPLHCAGLSERSSDRLAIASLLCGTNNNVHINVQDVDGRPPLFGEKVALLWHHRKEEFVCEKLFGKVPQVKGAISGVQGNRIWAIWTHRFYEDPKSETDANTLYILRFVVENTETSGEKKRLQIQQMKEIIGAAQEEAGKWDLSRVVL